MNNIWLVWIAGYTVSTAYLGCATVAYSMYAHAYNPFFFVLLYIHANSKAVHLDSQITQMC